jgi:Ni/Fe-hydrogenase b-type cytochrome subunit
MGTRWLTTDSFRGRHGGTFRATYEHPWLIRLTHWLSAVAVVVMAASGLQILRAFPAFGSKVPERDIVDIPRALALGGWLAGGLQWHFTFMWFFGACGILYVATQIVTARYRMVVFRPRDVAGVWPMIRHYFLFGPKPAQAEPYNPLQKLAYTATLAFGALSLLTGLVLYKPAQFSPLAAVFGGYHLARIWHFAAMCALVAFIPAHIVMVAIHGWNNFSAMLTGWRREADREADGEAAVSGPGAEPGMPEAGGGDGPGRKLAEGSQDA